MELNVNILKVPAGRLAQVPKATILMARQIRLIVDQLEIRELTGKVEYCNSRVSTRSHRALYKMNLSIISMDGKIVRKT